MHEVAIAQNILNIASDELKKHKGRVINKLHLQVGVLSGVVIESLEFALEASRPDSVLQHAKIQIDEIPGRAQCRSCGHEFEADDYYVLCPRCQGIEIDFLSGKELLLKSIVIT